MKKTAEKAGRARLDSTWRAYHHAELDYRGTEGQCKRWAREREDATIADPYGFVRWTTRNGRLCRVG